MKAEINWVFLGPFPAIFPSSKACLIGLVSVNSKSIDVKASKRLQYCEFEVWASPWIHNFRIQTHLPLNLILFLNLIFYVIFNRIAEIIRLEIIVIAVKKVTLEMLLLKTVLFHRRQVSVLVWPVIAILQEVYLQVQVIFSRKSNLNRFLLAKNYSQLALVLKS